MGWIGAVLGGVGDALGNIFGGGRNNQPSPQTIIKQANNTPIFILGGVAVIGILLFLFLGNKRR